MLHGGQPGRHRPGHHLLGHRHPRRPRPAGHAAQPRRRHAHAQRRLLLDDGSAVVGQAALDVALEQPDRVATLIKRRMGDADLRPARRRPRLPARDARPPSSSASWSRTPSCASARSARRSSPCRPTSTTPAARPPRTPAASPAWTSSTSSTSRPPRPWPTRSSRRGRCTAAAEPLLPDEQRTVLVYDLGGGTFDVTLVRLSQQRFQTLAIEGDVRLGGKDWDDRIVDHVADAVPASSTASDPRTDPQSLAALQRRRRAGQADAEQAAADERHLHARRQGADGAADAGRVRGR